MIHLEFIDQDDVPVLQMAATNLYVPRDKEVVGHRGVDYTVLHVRVSYDHKNGSSNSYVTVRVLKRPHL